uniref:Uncharacterized protein AlNc14C98G5939 n=1 Tax=Albugo laibachii Nc14 TaxID=890382 RepID=F0WH70_9STRA|nr:conserved hypothetical protein [Albugo laibachii Nc14]|eukprot:CCA20585.1 conserved hypothetical protein [Albugo laibachii Nc14]
MDEAAIEMTVVVAVEIDLMIEQIVLDEISVEAATTHNEANSKVAEFRTREDMEQAIKKLDDTEFQGNYVRITAADKGSDRRSASPQAAATQRSDCHMPMARFQSQECLICLNELQTNLAAVQCGHVFHLICIKEAFEYKKQCPVCRKSASRSFITPLFLNLNEVPAHIEEENSPVAASTDTANVRSLTAQLRWQKVQMQAQSVKIKRLRDHLKILSAEKKIWDEKYNQIALLRTYLMNQVTKYRLVIDRQANMIQRLSINKAVVQLLDTKDSIVLERELIDPGDRILALKKACQYRTKQYQDAVREKNCLKSALEKMEERIQCQHNKSVSMSSVLHSRGRASENWSSNRRKTIAVFLHLMKS